MMHPAIFIICLILAVSVGVAIGWFLCAVFRGGAITDQIIEDEKAKMN